ncbi:kynurenine formamidase [Paenibacillus baekrokdamisoli]|nr:hypothetical protein [Paenibacillus baekrokdamisoli]MBB3072137.1 kynurenine formamidase [Paenibacillus baekrokdamisoli]
MDRDEHGCIHIGALLHMLGEGETIEKIDLEPPSAYACVVNLTGRLTLYYTDTLHRIGLKPPMLPLIGHL